MGATPARRVGWKAVAEATTAVKTAARVNIVASCVFLEKFTQNL